MKRTFHVCLSVGINGYIEVAAESKREARAIVKRFQGLDLNLYNKNEVFRELEVADAEPYEFLIGNIIDLEEIDKAVKRMEKADEVAKSKHKKRGQP